MNARLRTLLASAAREARPFRSLLVVVIAYWCCKALFFVLTSEVGLLAPSGSLNLGIAAFGICLIALRIWVLFFVPAILVYRLARHIQARATSGGSTSGSGRASTHG